jgi:signal transduction histidine kinase
MSLHDELRAAFLTEGLTDDEREELIAAGTEVHFAPGDELFHEGRVADALWILLEGEIELTRAIGGQSRVMTTMATAGQWAGGLSAWGGAEGVYRASGRALTPGRCLVVPSDELGALVGRWSPFAKHLMLGVYQTVRSIDTTVRERESLVALGTLAAGLAHEINNPASASMRSAEALRNAGDYMVASLVGLADCGVGADDFRMIDRMRTELEQRPAQNEAPRAVAEREELIGTWLEDRKIGLAWHMAPVLASSGVDQGWLEELERTVGSAVMFPALRWISSTLGMKALFAELDDATGRIVHLVEDVKTYSAMGRAEVQRVDLRSGLDSTLAIMTAELAGIDVVRSYDPDLPQIDVHAAELNQVWTKLIDNAIDAMGGHGTLTVATLRDGDDVVVAITDSGSGLDPAAQPHVFEPFFTTKDVGKGTGLGLDISRRIVVDRHGGDIDFEWLPGATTVRVRIPMQR